jgi:hypothetical protein
MLREFIRQIGTALVAVAAVEAVSPAAAAGTGAERRRQFDQQAEEMLAARPDPDAPLAAGAVQLLGLWDIRNELGEAWAEVAANAYGVIERVLRQHLTGADVFTRKGEDSYILCFATLDKNQAERKTKQIVEEVKTILLRDVPEARRLRVGHQMTEVPAAALKGGSLLDTIAASLESVKQEAEEVFDRQRRLLMEEASVVFGPVWSRSRQSIVLHRCVLDDWTSRTTLQNLEKFSEPESLQKAISDLDYLILGRAIQTLHGILQSNGTAVLLVPVHYQTLAHKASRDEYLTLCNKMPKPYVKFIFFEVYGIPSQAPASRVLQIVKAVQPHGNAVVVSFPIAAERNLFDLGSSGVYGVALALDELGGSGPGPLAKYAAAANAAGLRTFAHGARTIGHAKASIEAGFDYVDGDAIAVKVPAPRGPYRWNPLEPQERAAATVRT